VPNMCRHYNTKYFLLVGLAVGCFLLTTIAATAAPYYVAPDGDDSNPGTIDQPWATVEHAYTTVNPGDTVYFREGTYVISSRLSDGPHGTSEAERTTFVNYAGETVIWDENQLVKPFHLNCDYLTIDGVEITNGANYGIELAGSHITIRNCKIYDHGNDIIKVLSCAPYAIIEHNEIYGTCGGNNMLDTVGSEGLTIRYNYFHDSVAEQAILMKGGANNAAVYSNLLVNVASSSGTYRAAICIGGSTVADYMEGLWECRDSTVYNNVVVNAGTGLIIWDARDCTAYNNTFVQLTGRYGVRITTTDLNEQTQNITLKNNIVQSAAGVNHKAMLQVDADSTIGLDVDHNLWFCDGGTEYFAWGVGYSDYGQRISFADYQVASGQDTNSIVADPLLMPDYHLTADSPAIDTGVYELGVPLDDLDGNVRPLGEAIDIGAFEYLGAGGDNTAPTLTWVGESGYEADGLEPETGNAATEFTWKIEYADADGDAPYGVYLHILDGGTELPDSPYEMSAEGSGDWSVGVVFAKTLTLAKGTQYTYYFSASDEHGAPTSYPASPVSGPQVSNSAPTVPTVTISPQEPSDQDDLEAIAEGSTDTDEGDEISYEYQWFADDVLQEDLTTAAVPAARTSGGQVWRCEVIATDGQDDSEAGTAQVTIGATYSVSGAVIDSQGNPFPDVTVSAGEQSASTDGQGNYTISGLVAGTYMVTPTLVGYGFVPSSTDVTVNETAGNAAGVDFAAILPFTVTLPDGVSMVGVPCTPVEDDDPTVVFGTTVLARWNGSMGDYVLPDPGASSATRQFLSVAPGKGYFVQMAGAADIAIAGVPVSTDTAFEQIALTTGWNLVANPFPQALPFANIMTTASRILPYGFVYDPGLGSYLLVTDQAGMGAGRTNILPWEGVWVRATESATLRIEPPVGPSQHEPVEPRGLDMGGGGWALPIIARVADRADLSSVAGVTEVGDGYQIDNPPCASGTVDLYFVGDGRRRLAHDVRPSSPGELSWEFVVSTDIVDSEVAISLPDLSAVPGDLAITLVDLDASRSVYARTMAHYTFRSNGEGVTKRHFRLTVAPKQNQGLVISAASVQPTQSNVTITYSVSTPCRVTIQVLNIAGRLVSTVCANDVATAGTNVETWRLRSQTGRLVPSGLYLVSVEAVGEDGQRVRTILPASVVR